MTLTQKILRLLAPICERERELFREAVKQNTQRADELRRTCTEYELRRTPNSKAPA